MAHGSLVWRVPVWCDPSSASFSLAWCQIGACHSDAFLIFAPILYAICFRLFDAYYFGAYLFIIANLFIEGVFLCHSEAFLIFILNQMQFRFCEGQLARTNFGAYLFFCIFLFAKKCCLRQFGAYYMLIRYALFLLRRTVHTVFDARVSLFFFFSFLQSSVVYINLARFSMARRALYLFAYFLLCASYCLRHIFINLIKVSTLYYRDVVD